MHLQQLLRHADHDDMHMHAACQATRSSADLSAAFLDKRALDIRMCLFSGHAIGANHYSLTALMLLSKDVM